MRRLLIFTDLDGTLLDHHDYSWEAARPALKRIATAGHPLIFNSSKTAAEISRLRQELNNRHPFIVENGSAVCVPAGYFAREYGARPAAADEIEVTTFGTAYTVLLGQLHPLRENAGYRFRGFADLTTTELASLTGLDEEHAAMAQQRNASEPILWDDSDYALGSFIGDLVELGLTLVKGGRFHHVMGQVDKADAMNWLITNYRKRWPKQSWHTVALGDSPNDREMLEAADIAVCILPAQGPRVVLRKHGDVLCPELPGPAGWNQAINQILDQGD